MKKNNSGKNKNKENYLDININSEKYKEDNDKAFLMKAIIIILFLNEKSFTEIYFQKIMILMKKLKIL